MFLHLLEIIFHLIQQSTDHRVVTHVHLIVTRRGGRIVIAAPITFGLPARQTFPLHHVHARIGLLQRRAFPLSGGFVKINCVRLARSYVAADRKLILPIPRRSFGSFNSRSMLPHHPTTHAPSSIVLVSIVSPHRPTKIYSLSPRPYNTTEESPRPYKDCVDVQNDTAAKETPHIIDHQTRESRTGAGTTLT